MGKSVIKVATITEDSRPAGPQTRIMRVANRLSEYNVETAVILPKNNDQSIGDKLNNLDVDHVEVQMTRPTFKPRPLGNYLMYFAKDVKRLMNTLKSVSPDIVHANGPHQIKGLVAAKVLGIPKVWHINDTKTMLFIKTIFSFLKYFITDGIIASSINTIDEYSLETDALGKPVTLIRPPVNVNTFDPCSISPDKQLLKRSSRNVVTVCNINPIKNIEMFIKVASKISRSLEDVSFYVVGPIYDTKYSYYKNLKRMAERSEADIVFCGYREDVRPVLKAADLFLCTSKHESGPLSVFEAMAMGVPVVSTDVGDLKSVVPRDSMACAVVDVEDVQSMASYACTFLEDRQLSTRSGLEGRRIVTEKLSLDSAVRRHRLAYEKSIAGYHS